MENLLLTEYNVVSGGQNCWCFFSDAGSWHGDKPLISNCYQHCCGKRGFQYMFLNQMHECPDRYMEEVLTKLKAILDAIQKLEVAVKK